MVEADLAELVDQHGGVGERRVIEHPVEQRGLAGAEKAGQHRERKGRDRTTGAGRRGHWVAGATLGLAALTFACFAAEAFAASGFAASDLAPGALAASGLTAMGLAAGVLASGFLASVGCAASVALAGAFGFLRLIRSAAASAAAASAATASAVLVGPV